MAQALTQELSPPHLDNLDANIEDVDRLIRLHVFIAGKGRGRPPNLEVLHKSGIVLLVACWEAYIEDLASSAFDALLDDAASPTVFPSKVLTLAAKPLRDSLDERELWKLAGQGWRSVLQSHRTSITDRYIGRLNTPRPKQVDELFENLIGLSSLSRTWSWQGQKNSSAIAKLNRLIDLRGEIAHRVSASRSVHRRYLESSTEFVYRLAVVSSNVVGEFVEQRIGSAPWATSEYAPQE